LVTFSHYVTLNSQEEAQQIGTAFLEQRLAICVNWFPITCAYLWEEKITQESEVVLIVKTRSWLKEEIETAIHDRINYTNFIAEISHSDVNESFLNWLNREVQIRSSDAEMAKWHIDRWRLDKLEQQISNTK